jgi:hypothetical protein
MTRPDLTFDEAISAWSGAGFDDLGPSSGGHFWFFRAPKSMVPAGMQQIRVTVSTAWDAAPSTSLVEVLAVGHGGRLIRVSCGSHRNDEAIQNIKTIAESGAKCARTLIKEYKA